jgi:hypothetical protein
VSFKLNLIDTKYIEQSVGSIVQYSFRNCLPSSDVSPKDKTRGASELQVFKSIYSGQMALRNGQTLTDSDCFSHVFILSIVGETISSSSSNDGPSNRKNICNRLAHSSLSLSRDLCVCVWCVCMYVCGVCVCVVCLYVCVCVRVCGVPVSVCVVCLCVCVVCVVCVVCFVCVCVCCVCMWCVLCVCMWSVCMCVCMLLSSFAPFFGEWRISFSFF